MGDETKMLEFNHQDSPMVSVEAEVSTLRAEVAYLRGVVEGLTQLVKSRQNVSRLSAATKKVNYPADFLEFYGAYPRREKKMDAYKAWIQTSETRPDRDSLMRAVEAYAAMGNEKKYTALPASWLRGARWEDSYDRTDGGVSTVTMTDIGYLMDRDLKSKHPRWQEYDRLYRAKKVSVRFAEWLDE